MFSYTFWKIENRVPLLRFSVIQYVGQQIGCWCSLPAFSHQPASPRCGADRLAFSCRCVLFYLHVSLWEAGLYSGPCSGYAGETSRRAIFALPRRYCSPSDPETPPPVAFQFGQTGSFLRDDRVPGEVLTVADTKYTTETDRCCEEGRDSFPFSYKKDRRDERGGSATRVTIGRKNVCEHRLSPVSRGGSVASTSTLGSVV